MRYIVVTGGVISGLGKGITASSIAFLIKHRGHSVTSIKIDPYLNIDAGTMSPYEHGECYVLADGGETDLDLGNYERFLDIELTRAHNITTGQVYKAVLDRERSGEYLGKTVQIVPHLTDEIKKRIKEGADIDVGHGPPEFCVIELGGTIGDMETAPFVEALRQFAAEEDHVCFVHVSLIVDSGELKTKPTQHSVRTLRSLGIIPDLLVVRSSEIPGPNVLKKLELGCQIKQDRIIHNTNVLHIHYVPELFNNQNVAEKIFSALRFEFWEERSNILPEVYTNVLRHYRLCGLPQLAVGIAGKYVGSQDTYLSLIRAIEHASLECGCRVNICWIDTENMTSDSLQGCDVMIIPGGFGSRGINGKLEVARWCRMHDVPILGICLGMQVMVVEYARSLGFRQANSAEWEPIPNAEPLNIIDILPDQQEDDMGGTMRLGNYTTCLNNSKVKQYYGNVDTIVERHRHRYEFNSRHQYIMKNSEMRVAGTSENRRLIEIVELKNHKYYVGCQFHPEYRSRFNRAHPLFVNLIMAALPQDE